MKRILLLILALLLFASPAWGMREIGYDDPIHPQIGAVGGFEPETEAYAATHTMTDAEKAALDLEIKSIKAGTPLTLSSLTLNLSLVSGAYFITRSSVDLNRYSGISGVQYSVAATGTPATTAVFSGAITAGTGETLGSGLFNNSDFASDEPPGTAWARGDGWTISGGVAAINGGAAYKTITQQPASVGQGKLLKTVFDIATWTSGGKLQAVVGNQGIGTERSSTGTFIQYLTVATTSKICGITTRADAVVATIDNVNFYIVLTPDATGILAAALTNGGIAANSATYVVTVSKP